jgi:hypothetical protein
MFLLLSTELSFEDANLSAGSALLFGSGLCIALLAHRPDEDAACGGRFVCRYLVAAIADILQVTPPSSVPK